MSAKNKNFSIPLNANIKGGVWSTQGPGITRVTRITERSPIGFSISRISRRR